MFVRHGHTAATVANGGSSEVLVSGWADFPLSPLGRRQVEALCRRLEGSSLDAIYSSPLQRAVATAAALAHLAPTPPRLLDGLREISCGELEGLSIDELRQRHPEIWEANLRQEDDDLRLPGGESYRELRDRCLEAIRRIAADHQGQRVLIVTHAGVISQVVGALHGRSPAGWDSFRPGLCSITEVEWEGEVGRLLGFDDRTHLE